MRDKRNILIISYHYLPEVMAASYRMHAWVRYLPKFGWKPFVLTRELDYKIQKNLKKVKHEVTKDYDKKTNCFIYRIPYKQKFSYIWDLRAKYTQKAYPNFIDTSIRRILNFMIGNFLMIPDERYDWYADAFKFGLSIIKKNQIDVLISTGAPWTDFWIASNLSKATGVPWIADYRDPWSQRTTLKFPKEYFIRMGVNRIWEKKIANTASAFIHISEPLQIGLIKTINRAVFHIPNGYDASNFKYASKYLPDKKKFTISFIGTLHNNTNTDVFMEGFYRFVRAKRISPKNCKIEFIGDTNGHKRIKFTYPNYKKIDKFFKFIPPVAQEEAIKRMCRSHILLSFPLNMEGCCPAKTYEYLASGRPILVSPDGKFLDVIRKILNQTNGGVILNSPEEIEKWIKIKFDEFSETGIVRSCTIQTAILEYSRENQVELLSQILNKVMSNPICSFR